MGLSRENILLAVASLLIAVGTRLALVPVLTTPKGVQFPATLEISEVPEGLTVVGAPGMWEMQAKGTAQYLDQLDRSLVTAQVNPPRWRIGVHDYTVQLGRDPSRGRLTLEPKYKMIRLNVEKLVSTERKVMIEPSGRTPGNYLYDGSTSTPSTVTVTGAESLVAMVTVVRVSLDLSQVHPGATFLLPLEPLDEKGRPVRNVQLSPQEVSINPTVAAAPVKKSVLVTPVWIGQPEFGYRVTGYSVKPSQVVIQGESDVISRLATIDTEPVDLSRVKRDVARTVKVKRTPGVSSLPAEVEVTVQISVAR